MKAKIGFLLAAFLMLFSVSANAQYYWYVGTTEPTAASNPATDPGWTELSSKPDKIPIFAEDPNWNDVQWYIAAPAEWGFVTTSNGMLVGGWTKTTVTINGVLYNVWKCQSLTDTVNTTLTKLGNSTDNYIYIGLNRPTSSTDPETDLASNNTPLYEGYGAAGWRNIGPDISIYNASYPAFNGGANTVILDKEFNNVLCYVAIPVGMGIYDGLGNPSAWTLDQSDITIKGNQYNVYKAKLEGECGESIYCSTGGDMYGETKYYWYAGTTLPTADNIASIAIGSSNRIQQWDGKEFSITNSGEESTPAYVCTPVDFKVSWKDTNGFTLNLVEVEGARFTLNGVEYIVQRRGRDLIAGATITFRGYYDETITSNDYYIYIGLNRPTSSTDPETDLASNNTPLYEGYGAAGWRNIGQDISIYNLSKPAYNGGYKTVILDKEFNNVLCYVAIPVGMGIYDGLGNPIAWTLDQSNITIKSRHYNVYKNTVEGECTNLIYCSTGGDETKYYWYAGPDMLTSETVPGINVENECSYGWHVITGNPTSIETGEPGTSDCPKINWVLAIPTALGLNHISNGVDDVTDAYDVSTVTAADGVEYTVFRQISQSKKTDRTFVDGETKYYWYYGTTLPTEENLTSIAGWSEDYPYGGFYLGLKAKLYNDTEQSADMYICTPAVYYHKTYNEFVWKDAGGAVDLTDVGTFTCGSIEYKVQKLASPLGAGEKKYIYAMESGDNITMSLDKSKAFLEKNHTMTLKATLNPTYLRGSDSNNSMTWKSSNTAVATVSKSGEVTGLKAGTAKITCTSNTTGLSATCTLTVGKVKLSKNEVSLQKGKTVTLKATVYPTTENQSVTWESSDKKVVTVSSTGKVTGVKTGIATITCTSNATGLSATCEVTVGQVKLSKTEVAIQKGKTVTLKATVYPTTLEDQSVTWKSSDEKIATVSSTGKVKGVRTGTAKITCTSNATGLSATCEVTVGQVKLSKSEVTIQKGKTVTLKATVYPTTLEDQSVTWESSNTKIATVSETGKVKGVRTGTVKITCISNATGLSATCTVTVTAPANSRSLGGGDDEVTGIDDMEVDPAVVEPFDVYDISGRKVRHQVTSLDGLPNGIYIVNGRKVLKKE